MGNLSHALNLVRAVGAEMGTTKIGVPRQSGGSLFVLEKTCCQCRLETAKRIVFVQDFHVPEGESHWVHSRGEVVQF